MKMDQAEGIAAMEVERFSKLGTLKLQQGHTQKALEAYKNAYHSAQALGQHSYMQRACAFNLGAMLISTGNYNDGMKYLNEAVPPEGRRDGRSNGDLYFNYGLAYEGLKNITESRNYFLKALDEYKSEQNNTKMEADCISRLGKLCMATSKYDEGESWMKLLIKAYDNLDDKDKKQHAQAERAHLLLKLSRVEEAEEVADECLKDINYFKPKSSVAVNTLIELGLVYTQLCMYDKALQCGHDALPLVKDLSADPKQVTVVYQNLGAIHNNMGQYEDALKYHEAAANKHAELKNRMSQGHCFINMGYAYSQLNDMDKAGECFLHALQAAKDCGDRKSEWQSHEALGSVYYKQGAHKRSQESYKQALTVLAKSPESSDNTIQERILGKLTFLIQQEFHKPKSTMQATNVIQKAEKVVTEKETGPEGELKIDKSKLLKVRAKSKDGNVITVKKGNQIKYLRVRRSGTLLRFKKVALGLEPFSSSPSPDMMGSRGLGLSRDLQEDEILSAYTTEISDLDDVEEDDEESVDRQKHERPPDSFHLHRQAGEHTVLSSEQSADGEDIEAVSSSESDEEDDDDTEEKKQIIAAYKQVAAGDVEGMLMSQTVTTEVIADVHATPQRETSSGDGESSDEESESESGSSSESSDEEKEESLKKAKLPAPPVPSLSPQPSTSSPMRTYENPNTEPHYQTIDHKPPAGNTRKKTLNAGERRFLNRRPSDDDGSNYFHSEDDTQFEKQKQMSGIMEEREEEKEERKGDLDTDNFDGTIYESIRPPSRLGRNTPGSDKDSDEADNEEEDESEMNKLSKGARDIIEFGAFQEDMKKRHEKTEQEDAEADQKSSKHCIVM